MLTPRFPRAGRLLGAVSALGTLAWAIRRSRRARGHQAARARADARRLLGGDRLAMVAHELRTPLGTIRYAAATVEATTDASPRVRAAGALIRRQVEHLGYLLGDLLVKAGAHTLVLECEHVDLAAVVSEVVDSLRGIVEERGHRLTLARPAGTLLVRGDRRRLAQVVTNLVWNSAKFTPTGGHVDLILARDDDHVMLQVRDDGIGIPPEQTDRIFRLFERAGAPDDHGLGIGLSLVQLIVTLHGGQIAAHSDGSGRGSEFTVRLPAAHVRVTPAVGQPRT